MAIEADSDFDGASAADMTDTGDVFARPLPGHRLPFPCARHSRTRRCRLPADPPSGHLGPAPRPRRPVPCTDPLPAPLPDSRPRPSPFTAPASPQPPPAAWLSPRSNPSLRRPSAPRDRRRQQLLRVRVPGAEIISGDMQALGQGPACGIPGRGQRRAAGRSRVLSPGLHSAASRTGQPRNLSSSTGVSARSGGREGSSATSGSSSFNLAPRRLALRYLLARDHSWQ